MADFVLGMHPLLKQEAINRNIQELLGHQMIADTLLTKSTSATLATRYMVDGDQDAFGRKTYEDVPELGEASALRRIGVTEVEKSEMIRRYGLEFVVTYEMQKWGLGSHLQRGLRRLADNVANMINTMAYKKITQDYTVAGSPTSTQIEGKVKAGSFWNDATLGAENMIADLIDARANARKFGFELDTVIMSPDIEAMMLKSKTFRDAFRVNNTDVALLRGYIGDFMGLTFISDPRFGDANDTVLMVQRGVIGDIVDAEGLRTKIYNQEEQDRTVIRVTRFTAVQLVEPKAVYLIKNVLS